MNPYVMNNPFQKKKTTATELPLTKLTFYNTTTKKQEEVEFCDSMTHLEKFVFYGLKMTLN